MQMLVWVSFKTSYMLTSSMCNNSRRRHRRRDEHWAQHSVEHAIDIQSVRRLMLQVTLTLTLCELALLLTWNIACHVGKQLEIYKCAIFTRKFFSKITQRYPPLLNVGKFMEFPDFRIFHKIPEFFIKIKM
jgi:hypothetical protein